METVIDLEIAVTVTDRANMERQLDEATSIAKSWAMEEGFGAFWSRDMTVTPSRWPSVMLCLSA